MGRFCDTRPHLHGAWRVVNRLSVANASRSLERAGNQPPQGKASPFPTWLRASRRSTYKLIARASEPALTAKLRSIHQARVKQDVATVIANGARAMAAWVKRTMRRCDTQSASPDLCRESGTRGTVGRSTASVVNAASSDFRPVAACRVDTPLQFSLPGKRDAS